MKRAVVIGTGAGGLTAAAYLARSGEFEVIALERAQQFGGFLNPFRRKRYEFDPGVHYVGRCAPGEEFWRVLNGLDIDAEAMFAELDPDGFDRYRFGDFEIAMCKGADRFRARLLEVFPGEEQGLDRFFTAIRQLDDLSRLQTRPSLANVVTAARSLPLGRWVRATFADFLAWVTDDPHLRDVLAAPCGDYGEPPSRASALYGLALFAHYIEGAYFPRGGSRALRDALLDRARAGGADFRRNTEVREIVVRDGEAVAVRTQEGEEIAADVVISAVSPALTLGTFLAGADLGRLLPRKVRKLRPSPASLCLFLGMERDLTHHGLGAFNIWSYPDWDIEASYAPLYRGEFPRDPMVFLSPNSLKDPTGSLAPAGCSTLELVTFAPYDMFAKWDGMRAMFRDDEYRALKRRLADQLLESVERRHPGLVGDVVIEEVATPVSNTHYVNSERGGIYGPAATPDQSILFRFRPNTPVPNVFLAGSGVFGGGVLPCLQSGRVAAALARRHVAAAGPR